MRNDRCDIRIKYLLVGKNKVKALPAISKYKKLENKNEEKEYRNEKKDTF